MLSQPPHLELWAGVECTVNRVGDQYFDQLERNGHATRLDDLDLFAQLGVRTMRYPVLWERTAPDGLESANWSWTDERLGRMRELGIRPIIGLVHHGSGPRHTSLIDPAFAEGLASFAQAVAERYPWVENYTPVNEPLTTARFSGLYGHWYPHGRDDLTFMRALLTQCRATVLSMQAIRKVNPTAQLVQTEDLGKTFSTPLLAYQAELENQRRWLSFDLLCGHVNRDHPLWGYLLASGISETEFEVFLDHPCPPDVMGINHYVTSDRFLDERLEYYPSWAHGGNGRHKYADVEAVRARAEGLAEPQLLLKEAWERYGIPIAITEAHLGSTREEQLRWLKEKWDAAQNLQHEGVDLRAVTVWSLLGAYDWNTLVTALRGHYEPGVFDLRSPRPRPTALAGMVRDLAHGKIPAHPVLDSPGWWRRPERLTYGPVPWAGQAGGAGEELTPRPSLVRPILIAGATGTLGSAFARLCEFRGISYQLLTRKEMDIANPASVDTALTELQPWAVINAAGYVRVDDAEREVDACLRVNADGPAILAESCARQGVALLTFSSDLVFDGTSLSPYVESDTVAPLNVYGRSKAEAEERVLKACPSALVIRTSAFFGPWDNYNFLTIALRTLAAGHPFLAAEDATVSPTYVPDLVHTSLDLLIDGECGVWHLANPGAIAWADLACLVAQQAGLDATRVCPVPTHTLGLAAPRPSYSVLGSERGVLLPSLENAIARYFHECEFVDQ
ncbi:family 1 glycosylhydrolase [Chroococcidiopsis sp. CCMEE 29]|uniref:family 1 glycosylhydrolase n=1 Tax=Chroococcidiopsis sp. CCMEE 29 TaxID=155894 RepID=UPI002020C473|nr:family 1 glycosylhydrolase [Chroococcidiopsis sp. CCMEE 29]